MVDKIVIHDLRNDWIIRMYWLEVIVIREEDQILDVEYLEAA